MMYRAVREEDINQETRNAASWMEQPTWYSLPRQTKRRMIRKVNKFIARCTAAGAKDRPHCKVTVYRPVHKEPKYLSAHVLRARGKHTQNR